MRYGERPRGTSLVNSYGTDRGIGVYATNAASDTITGGSRVITWHADGKLIVVGQSILVEYLVVGGGGAGVAGAGGAGGYKSNYGGTKIVVGPGEYDVVVGAGGDSTKRQGGFSSFYNILCIGGGSGSSSFGTGAVTGASSGGHSVGECPTYAEVYQGSDLGTGNRGGAVGAYSGGGGGSGGVGSSASLATIPGGVGITNAISGTSVTYAAGGTGTNNGTAGAATTNNTGNGGNYTRDGASGIVIVRF